TCPTDSGARGAARLVSASSAGSAPGYRRHRAVAGAEPDRRRACRRAAHRRLPHLRLDRERSRRHAAPAGARRRRPVHQRPGRWAARRRGQDEMTTSRVAVIGAGTMGHGIAYAAALAGFEVRITDSQPDALRRAMGRLNDLLAIAVKRGKLTEEDRDAAATRLRAESDFAPAVREAEVVIEAV